MEAIIIVIVIAVVGYYFYHNLPNTKFERAQKHFNSNNFHEAIIILNEIIGKHVDAPSKLAECKLNLGLQESNRSVKLNYFNEVIALRKKFGTSTSSKKFDSIEAKSLFEIAKIQFNEAQGNIDKLNENIKFIESANKKGSESDFSFLKNNHFYSLADCHYKIAVVKEKEENLSEAIRQYSISKNFAKNSNNIIIKNNSEARITICQLKQNSLINLKNSSEFEYSDKQFQIEIYYRFAIQNIQNKEFSEAEKIISKHLNFKSDHIDRLIEILNAEKNNNALKKVDEINTLIERLYGNSLSNEDLKIFYDSIDISINEVKLVDKQLAEKISVVKLNLFNRLLTQYISTEQFENAITIIQEYPKFWESPELLKNLGICCFGFTAKGLLSKQNYKTVISSWLTSVFSDKVILKSLDDTTWDDKFTFTLSEAIGSSYFQHEEIPSNVNYDDVSESNISIGATQKELLQQFETIIHKEIQDSNLSQLIINFYNYEKESIENIIDVIESDTFFATPFFAITHKLNNKILKELDNDYYNYSNENALLAGTPYINNSATTVVYQYFIANDLLNKILTAIENENSATIRKLNTKENRLCVEKFETIGGTVEDKILDSISIKINENDENATMISVMEESIAFSKQNNKLKHQYSNYVANFCVSKVNKDEIDNFKALTLMKGAYLNSQNNPKIIKNLVALIRFNLLDILNERTRKTTEIFTLLDWFKKNMSHTYKENSSELGKTRKEILQQLKEAGTDITLFNSNYPTISSSGQTLNQKGLKMKKVLKYLEELSN